MAESRGDGEERTARRASRRSALEKLAGHVRELVDATVNTDVAPEEVHAVADSVAVLVERLNHARHKGPYSGLVGEESAIDPSHPTRAMPLSPFTGDANPIAPPLSVRFDDGKVVGHVALGKQYSGPPSTAHGGVVAGLLDQLLALAGVCAGTGGVTALMKVRFRKPTPLEKRLDVVGWAEPRTHASRQRRVFAEIRHGDEVTAEAEAVVVMVPQLSRAAAQRPSKKDQA